MDGGDPRMLTGAETYEALDLEQRRAFDAEWQAALTVAARDCDLEPLVLHVCRWWVAGGGDVGRAAEAKSEFKRMSGRHDLVVSGPVVCECTAVGILGVLTSTDAEEFCTQFAAEAAQAAVSRDWDGMWQVLFSWYVRTQETDADLAALRDDVAYVAEAVRTGRVEEMLVDPDGL